MAEPTDRGSENSATNSFNDARDGKQTDKTVYATPAEKRSADKVLSKENDPLANSLEKQTARSAHEFNVATNVAGSAESKKEDKRLPPPPYQSEKTGVVYASECAKAAARNLDAMASEPKPQISTEKHHAPAPTPIGAAPNLERGVSSVQKTDLIHSTTKDVKAERAEAVLREAKKRHERKQVEQKISRAVEQEQGVER